MPTSDNERQAAIDAAHAAAYRERVERAQATTNAVTSLALEVRKVTTTVELRTAVPVRWPVAVEGETAGVFTEVRVSVTRYVGEGHEDDEPFYRAEGWFRAEDRRVKPYWRALPYDVARRLIGRALT